MENLLAISPVDGRYYETTKELSNYFSEYASCFSSAFQLMDSALQMGDFDGSIAGVNQISELFNKEPIIKNTEDFKKKIFENNKVSF